MSKAAEGEDDGTTSRTWPAAGLRAYIRSSSFGLRVALGLRKKEISHSSDKPSKGKLFEQGTSSALRVLAL